MIAGRVRAAGAMLAAGLFLMATLMATLMAVGCSGSTATASHAAPSATTTAPATTAAAAASFPSDFVGVSPASTATTTVVAVYSANDGHLVRNLTVPLPGGGPGGPRLSPDGRTVIFSRGQGTCAQTIDTVPFGGGREQVLISMTGTGNNGILPGDPSYSADGRYLIYDTEPCNPSAHPLLHIRDLSTGRELTRVGFLGDADSVFLDHDSEVVFDAAGAGPGTGLEVLRMPSMALTAYPAPHGCRYQALAGPETETGLDALLQCSPGDKLSVVAISPRTFTVTSTLIRLGSCLGGETISLAPADPSAILAETYNACLPPTARGDYRIVKIRAGQAWRITSGQDVPQAAFW